MEIPITNTFTENLIFFCLFSLALIATAKLSKTDHSFTPALTNELKGLAILAVIFSHIGYFLVTDHSFLFPLSILAGVGVNLFLFLSGFGLTLSTLKSSGGIWHFYKKRLPKLFLPMWIILTLLLLADFFILHRNYPLTTTIQNYFGFFSEANLYIDINSPFWYFTMILFYYLLFPLVFHKRFPYLAPPLLIIIPFLVFKLPLPIAGVLDLYKVHYISFPVGVFFGLLIQDKKFSQFRIHFKNIFLRSNLKFLLIPLFLGVFAYTSIYSGVGLDKEIEQTTSLITMFSIIFVFLAKNIEFKIFQLFGKYSYEIYLFHWPLLARFDVFYKYLPASIATTVYLAEFIFLAFLFQKFIQKNIIPQNQLSKLSLLSFTTG